MHITEQRFAQLIRAHDFAALFIQHGWDEGLQEPLALAAGERRFVLHRIAQKRGFVVCVCDVGDDCPPQDVRRKLLRELGRHHYEHLLIMQGGGRQIWSLTIRPQNRPLRFVEVDWFENQDAQLLMQKMDGMLFGIDEEGDINITDVVDRVRNAFMANADRVTRKFYREFQTELTAFAGFIDGIEARITRDWYAALMLNRLMFIYFIQKRGFLDDDSNYLENRLRKTQAQFGKDQFQRKFYRRFLRRLFAEGLGTPPQEREPELRAIIGKVPYLNGGLFDLHDIEKDHRSLAIPDAAFERLFAFFAQYNWHLDARPDASGRDINPDVIGYIFEKYINDRAAMGAYYTQEDITGYIARNTIIPRLLRRAEADCANAFDARAGIWRLLRERPDDYIYPAARKGCDIPDSELPADIKRGLDAGAPGLLARRGGWNAAADARFALPTETWREVVARRARYFALKEKMQRGGIHRVDDLITHNLDIERFAADALSDYEGSDFIAAFFAAIAGRKGRQSNHEDRRGVTVLDPACGSGAFLFAALNVLELLYEKCIERMEEFVAEDDRLRAAGARKGSKKHGQFRKVLKEIRNHPNRRYWIYKTIILNNLYGVDLMKEAAEIAKLRLFLKLAAEARYDPAAANLGLEPLPDIDFNIRAGNSLVGFSSMAEFEAAATSELDLSGGLISQIREDARTVRMADNAFRKAQNYQAQNGKGGEDYRRAKRDLAARLDALNQNMNRYLAKQYGIDDAKPAEYEAWAQSHRPFHWLAEFYGIIEEDGGFDVVIGNPPYVSVSKLNYRLAGDAGAFNCPDIYGHMTKKALELTSPKGQVGFIVMHSLAFSGKFADLRKVIAEKTKSAWFSAYGRIPSGLFSSEVRVRNCIALMSRDSRKNQTHTTRLHRWNASHRESLFPLLHYVPFQMESVVPMFNDSVQAELLENWKSQPLAMPKKSGYALQFKKTAYNFISVSPDEPPCFDSQEKAVAQTNIQSVFFEDDSTRDLAMLFFGGRMFFSYWLIYGNDFSVTQNNLSSLGLPIQNLSRREREKLASLADEFKIGLPKTLQFKLNAGLRVGSYNTSKLWRITDQSDMIFLRHLTPAPELAFESIVLHTTQTIKTELGDA